MSQNTIIIVCAYLAILKTPFGANLKKRTFEEGIDLMSRNYTVKPAWISSWFCRGFGVIFSFGQSVSVTDIHGIFRDGTRFFDFGKL
jgi:hypothetical protein